MPLRVINCPKCGTNFAVSGCISCIGKVHGYKCQKCGFYIINKLYGKRVKEQVYKV